MTENQTNTPQTWSALSLPATEAIRAAALRTLEKVGMKIQDSGVRHQLQEAGAIVQEDRVRFPEHLVREAMNKAPVQVQFYSRDGKNLSSASGVSYCSQAPSAVAILEMEGGRRTSTYQDVADLTRLADALPGIDFISPPAIAQDCPKAHSGLLTAEATFCNTNKFCLVFALNRAEAQGWVDMAVHSAGGAGALQERPTIGFAISPTSPLIMAKETSDILLEAASQRLPIVTVPGGMAGATSPYTIAGTLVVEHAEALAVVVIAQLFHPGAPCVLGLATGVMDMSSGNITLGAPERTLILNGAAPLARAWGLPGYAPAGLTDSFAFDEQAGGEKMLSFVTQLLSGLAFSAGIGRYEAGLSTSYEGVMLDHELLQMARRYVQGICVNEDTLAEEVIARVGPSGNFLGQPHTRKQLHSQEFWRTSLFNRKSSTGGGQPALQKAHQAVQEILSKTASPISMELQAEYKSIISSHISRQI